VGKWYGFIDTADFDMVIGRNGSQTLIADGLATAVSVTFGTTSHKIGSACIALCVSATQWAVINIGATTATVG
jgi:hypothetical protein